MDSIDMLVKALEARATEQGKASWLVVQSWAEKHKLLGKLSLCHMHDLALTIEALLRAEKPEDDPRRNPAFRILKDGNRFCAILADFKDLQESPSGWGSTPQEALANLIEPTPKPERRTCETCKRYWREAKKCKWLGHVPRECKRDDYSSWEPAASDGKGL